jgi:hypothetical protein
MNTTTQRSSIADRLLDKPVAARPSPPATGNTVTIACRLAMGVILSVYRWEEYIEPGAAGPRPAKRAIELDEKRIVLKGWATPNAVAGTINPVGTAHGYGLTSGVPRDTWEA